MFTYYKCYELNWICFIMITSVKSLRPIPKATPNRWSAAGGTRCGESHGITSSPWLGMRRFSQDAMVAMWRFSLGDLRLPKKNHRMFGALTKWMHPGKGVFCILSYLANGYKPLKRLGIPFLVGKIKFFFFFQGPKRLSELMIVRST